MRILRGLTGRTLSCGCLARAYETYGGEIVWIVDARDPACGNTTHAAGQQLAGAPDAPPSDEHP